MANTEGQRPYRRAFQPTSRRWIREGLLDSAQSFALSAMHALTVEDFRVFYLHAGTTVEQLAKAFLAFHHPALVCGQDFDSLLHVCGFANKARRPPANVKTVTAREAVDRASQLLPALGHLSKDIGLFLDLRNGVAHFLLITSETAARDRVAFFRTVSVLLDPLRMTEEEFWGEYAEFVQLVLAKDTTATQLRVAARVVSAKAAFETRYGGLDARTRAPIISAIEGSYVHNQYEEDLAVCPACDSMGVASGTYEVEWKEDWDYGEQYDPRGIYPEVTIYPGYFLCRVCGLELDGDDELEAAGLPLRWEIEDVDPRDFRDDDQYD